MKGILDLLDQPQQWWQTVIIVIIFAGPFIWLDQYFRKRDRRYVGNWIQCSIIGVLFLHDLLKQPSGLSSVLTGVWLLLAVWVAILVTKEAQLKKREPETD